MRLNKLALLPLLFLLPIQAEAATTFEELCKYDPLCNRDRNPDGSIMKPKPSVKKLIETMSDEILEYAQLYEVDPRAVAGAIMAENSMNVQIDDEIQNWLVKHNIWGNKALLDAGMTVGPGQIYIEPAMEAEKHLASLGIRSARSQEDIQKRLLTPAGSAEYAAAIIREAQDAYKDAGIDISGKPEVLTSLYNMGKYKEHAEATKKNKTEPRPNFFGFFVGQNIHDVEESLGWSPEKGRFRKPKPVLDQPGDVAVLPGETRLASAPPKCSAEGAGDRGEWNARISNEPYPTFSTGNASYVAITGRTVDCHMREWLQVQTDLGEIGWVPKADIQSGAEEAKNWRLTNRCEEPGSKCLTSASKAYGEDFLKQPFKEGKYYIPLKKKDPNDPVEASGEDEYGCDGMPYDDYKKQLLASQQRDQETKKDPLTKKQMIEYLRAAGAKKEELKRAFGITSNNADNRNYTVASLASFSQYLSQCLDNDKLDCTFYGSSDSLQFLYRSLSSYKTLSELNRDLSNLSLYVNMQEKPPTKEEAKKKLAEIREKYSAALENAAYACGKLRPYFPKLAAGISALLKEAETATPQLDSYMNPQPYLENLIAVCGEAWFLSDYKKTGQFPNGENELSCEFYSSQNGEKTLLNYTMDLLKKMEIAEEDVSDMAQPSMQMVKAYIKSSKNAHTSSSSPQDEDTSDRQEEIRHRLAACNYNRLETAKALDGLSTTSCVQTILVSSMQLLKALAVVPKAHVVLDTNLPKDSLAVMFKGTCTTDLVTKRRPAKYMGPEQREKK